MHNIKAFRYLRHLIIFLFLFLPIFVPGLASAAGNAIVSVAAPVDTLNPGQQFTVNINVEPNNAIAGMQFNLSYDPNVVTVNNIAKGNLLSQGGANTYFNHGHINNVTGTVTGVFGTIISPGQAVASPGTFAIITMTAGSAGGSSPLTLSNVVIGDIASQSVPVNIINDIIDVATTAPSPPPSGGNDGSGGGGSSGGGSGGASSITIIRGFVDNNGLILEDVVATDIDSKVELWISKDTLAKNKYGQALTSLNITPEEEIHSPTQGSVIIGQPYKIEPDGATFDGSVVLVFRYSVSEILADVPFSNLYIALWDPDTMTWTDLGGTVDTEAGAVSISINHLSTYALMLHNRPARISVTNFILTPDEVAPGEVIKASIDITNKGDLPGTYQANLMLDDVVIQTRDITVDGGSNETIVFAIVTGAVGEHQVSLGDMVATFVVKKPPTAAAFAVSELNINPISVISGENVDISVLVNNTSDLAGTYPATLSVDDVTVETREVTLEGGGNMTLSFSFSTDAVGEHTVNIGDLQGVLEVKSPSPPVVPDLPALELKDFSATPDYDEITNTLVSVRIEYQMNQTWLFEPDARLMMTVLYNGELLEQIPLFTLEKLIGDGKTGELNYIPSAGWMAGEYTFQVELYNGENVLQDTLSHSLVVTPEALTKVASWWTLGAVIGIATILIIILLAVIVYRRRDMLRS